MKKFILLGFLLAIVGIMATGCSCESGNKKQETQTSKDYDGVVPDFTAGVRHIQALHRQTMYSLVFSEYEWRNSEVILSDTITVENIDELKVVDVTDVFFYWNTEGPHVQYITSNVVKGTMIPPAIRDIWIEDDDLDNCNIRLSAEDALQRLKEWNGIIPTAIGLSLRRPVGAIDCNAQWVIGDVYDVIFIDAVTGEITDWCPAFPKP